VTAPPRTKEIELKNLWEGCVPFEEAILIIGVDDEFMAEEFERMWDHWDRNFEAC
jgi:hypothetical protein